MELAGIFGEISTAESKFTICRWYRVGGFVKDADNFLRDGSLSEEVSSDSGYLGIGIGDLGTPSQAYRANSGR